MRALTCLTLLTLGTIAGAEERVRFHVVDFRPGGIQRVREVRLTNVELTPTADGTQLDVHVRESRRDLLFLYGRTLRISRAHWNRFVDLRDSVIQVTHDNPLEPRGVHVRVPAGSELVNAELTSQVPFLRIRPPAPGSTLPRLDVEMYAWLVDRRHPVYARELGLFVRVQDIEVTGPTCAIRIVNLPVE